MHSTRATNIHKLHPLPEKNRLVLGLCRFSAQWNTALLAPNIAGPSYSFRVTAFAGTRQAPRGVRLPSPV